MKLAPPICLAFLFILFGFAPRLCKSATDSCEILTAEGGTYLGRCKNELAHGIGLLTWPNGNRYEGNFVEGKRTGKGVFTWARGDRYEGDFIEDKRTGKGVYSWADGNRYEGDFLDGKMIGKGLYKKIDGSVAEVVISDDGAIRVVSTSHTPETNPLTNNGVANKKSALVPGKHEAPTVSNAPSGAVEPTSGKIEKKEELAELLARTSKEASDHFRAQYASTRASRVVDGFLTDQNGCKQRTEIAHPDYSVSWTGGCVNGYIEGHGIFVFRDQSDPRRNYTYEGNMKAGRRHGKGKLVREKDGSSTDGNWEEDWQIGYATRRLVRGDGDIRAYQKYTSHGRWEGDYFVVTGWFGRQQGPLFHDYIDCSSEKECNRIAATRRAREQERLEREIAESKRATPSGPSSYCSTSEVCFQTVETRRDEVTITCIKGSQKGQTTKICGPNNKGKWASGCGLTNALAYHYTFKEAGNMACGTY